MVATPAFAFRRTHLMDSTHSAGWVQLLLPVSPSVCHPLYCLIVSPSVRPRASSLLHVGQVGLLFSVNICVSEIHVAFCSKTMLNPPVSFPSSFSRPISLSLSFFLQTNCLSSCLSHPSVCVGGYGSVCVSVCQTRKHSRYQPSPRQCLFVRGRQSTGEVFRVWRNDKMSLFSVC